MTVRTTQIQNTLFNLDSNPNVGALVKATLVLAASPQYNGGGGDNGKDIQVGSESTYTAGTAPAAPTATNVVGGGALGAGTYNYSVAFYNATTNTESARSVLSNTVTALANDRTNLTVIPLGPTGTTARFIYRTTVGGNSTTLAFLTSIANNTATTYTDAAADSVLTGANLPLVLGQYRLNLISPADLLPATGYYTLQQGVNTVKTTSFAYSSTPVLASTLYASTPAPSTPTTAMTGYVLDVGGNGLAGIQVTATLSAPGGTSTVSSVDIPAGSQFNATTDINGAYTLNVIPTDRMTPGGLYYTVVVGNSRPGKTIAAPNAGGTVNGNIITPVAATQTVAATLSPVSAQTGDLNVTGFVKAAAFPGTGAPAFAAVTAQAGTGATAVGSSGTDISGVFVLVGGSASWGAGQVGTVTYHKTDRAVAPVITFTPGDAATAAAWAALKPYSTSTATVGSLRFQAADTAQHTYTFNYTVSG